jgi:hypothetical protein
LHRLAPLEQELRPVNGFYVVSLGRSRTLFGMWRTALASHARGHRFETRRAHPPNILLGWGFAPGHGRAEGLGVVPT